MKLETGLKRWQLLDFTPQLPLGRRATEVPREAVLQLDRKTGITLTFCNISRQRVRYTARSSSTSIRMFGRRLGESSICLKEDEARIAHAASQTEHVGGRLSMEQRLRVSMGAQTSFALERDQALAASWLYSARRQRARARRACAHDLGARDGAARRAPAFSSW